MELVYEAIRTKKYVLEIDTKKLSQTSNISEELELLASMVGYKPYFGFSYQIILLIDKLLSSTTGQSSGLSGTPASRFSEILDSTANAIDSIRLKQLSIAEKNIKDSEYDVSINMTSEKDMVNSADSQNRDLPVISSDFEQSLKNLNTAEDAVNSLKHGIVDNNTISLNSFIPSDEIPVVLISHFENRPTVFSEELMSWAARLVTSGSAHVIFTSNNVSVYRDLQQEIPLKALTILTLGDASLENSLFYVYSRLRKNDQLDSSTSFEEFSNIHRNYLNPIGGRLVDLDYYTQGLIRGKTPEGKNSFNNVIKSQKP
ncbi:Mitochondrial escape protein 2 [Smittium mucronatum]|uniref:Mitochondrial escape protein 2 n=1 Tax=Smittium mucronatum TaxID=133383 RepID=A0A1R0GVT2_9FUNG|nr:Mitochondrial escape protein 2 [Smittium mucronatum]